MAKLQVLHYPDPRLRLRASPVERADPALERLVDDMLETMYDAPGIGLAAVQVGEPRRVIVVDVSEDRSEPLALVNPRLEAMEGEIETEEGCLSVPGIYEPVRRAERIRVTAMDPRGKPLELEAQGLLAVCIQHEVDHLDGRLFVDYLSRLKQQRIRKRLTKRERQSA